MGQALGTGLILKNAVKAEQIYVYDKYQKILKIIVNLKVLIFVLVK